jgi:hypothetical protein
MNTKVVLSRLRGTIRNCDRCEAGDHFGEVVDEDKMGREIDLLWYTIGDPSCTRTNPLLMQLKFGLISDTKYRQHVNAKFRSISFGFFKT